MADAGEYDVLHVNQPHGFRAARAVHRRHPGVAFVHRSHGFELHVARRGGGDDVAVRFARVTRRGASDAPGARRQFA